MKRHIIEQPRQVAAGFYRVAVVDAKTQRVVWEQKDWGHNLILNNGLNGIAVRTWAASFTVASAGTGVTPTSRSAPTASAAQSGTSVTGTNTDFAAGDVGNMIKWGSGEEARITAVTNPTTVAVTPSQSVSDGVFTVYHTNQTDVGTLVKRTNTYLAGAPNCQTAYDGATAKMRRTFDFTAETGTVNYTEVALGWHLSLADNCFSRILLPSAVPVNAGQQLRLVYELQVTQAPITPQAITAAVSGWPVLPSTVTTGFQQLLQTGLDYVANTGAAPGTGIRANEPAVAGHVWLSPNSSALTTFDTTPADRTTNGAYVAATLASYTTFNFYTDKTGVFAVGEANRTDFRSMGIGLQDGYYSFSPYYGACCFAVLFDQNQAKANTQTLTLTFRSTWSRVLA